MRNTGSQIELKIGLLTPFELLVGSCLLCSGCFGATLTDQHEMRVSIRQFIVSFLRRVDARVDNLVLWSDANERLVLSKGELFHTGSNT